MSLNQNINDLRLRIEALSQNLRQCNNDGENYKQQLSSLASKEPQL